MHPRQDEMPPPPLGDPSGAPAPRQTRHGHTKRRGGQTSQLGGGAAQIAVCLQAVPLQELGGSRPRCGGADDHRRPRGEGQDLECVFGKPPVGLLYRGRSGVVPGRRAQKKSTAYEKRRMGRREADIKRQAGLWQGPFCLSVVVSSPSPDLVAVEVNESVPSVRAMPTAPPLVRKCARNRLACF